MSKKSTKTSKPKAAKVSKVKAAKAEAAAPAPRESRNGIPRPAAESICGSVWAFLDANKGATANDVIAGIKNINPATARTQTQRYKKFHS